ncbi:MAG: hypothetical protein M1826_006812 [Phylliscum demangeonii]|nr:MAG: hypothetical protein M1826_006812 [Phylliscum demangeonii]
MFAPLPLSLLVLLRACSSTPTPLAPSTRSPSASSPDSISSSYYNGWSAEACYAPECEATCARLGAVPSPRDTINHEPAGTLQQHAEMRVKRCIARSCPRLPHLTRTTTGMMEAACDRWQLRGPDGGLDEQLGHAKRSNQTDR